VADGAYALAFPLAERLLAADPGYGGRVAPVLVRAAAGLASDALAAGQPAEALPWLDRALSALGDEATLLLLSARAYRALGDAANARYHFDRAARFDPTLARKVADELRGLILEQAAQLRAGGEADSALALLTEAVQRYPGDAAYPRVLAELQLDRGEVDAAAAALDRALALGDEGAVGLALRVSEAQRARAEQGMTRVAVEVSNGVLYLAVRVNDQPTPLRFVLDTGASHTAISSRVASALGVRPRPGAVPLSVSTANGRALALPTVLRSVAVSDLRVEDVPALILDGLNEADGLLGLSFLQRFQMEVHANAGYVTLRPR
jgi:clan AA aspartic protease (TIGR02281 family)